MKFAVFCPVDSGTTTDDADLTDRVRLEISRYFIDLVKRRTTEISMKLPIETEYPWYRCYPWSITRKHCNSKPNLHES